MTYPGNTSLSEEIRERIASTFAHTLDLAAAGKLQEALTGCEFILQLDPLFEPARQLQGRLEASSGPVAVDDLRPGAAPPPLEAPTIPQPPGAPAAQAADDDIFDLGAPARASAEPAAPSPPLEREIPPLDAPVPPLEAGPEAPPATAAQAPAADDEPSDELESALDLSMLGSMPDSGEAGAIGAPAPAPKAGDETAPEEVSPPGGEPAAALDAESEGRIAELLAEGQTAFEDKQYQSAIDAWSRIFLIDIDHAEASRRIELARKLKAEVERQVEEVFHEAVLKVESGDFESARAGFQRVLEMHPSHLSAQEYLEKLDSGGFSAPAEAPTAPPPAPGPAAAPAGGGPPGADLEAAPALDAPGDDLLSAPALDVPDAAAPVEAPTGPPPQAKPQQKPAPKRAGFRPSIVYVGGAVLLLVLAGFWFLWSNWDSTFPNAGEQATAAPRPRIDPIARAIKVHDDGDTALAIAQLKRLPPSHARYAEAQALIAQWEAPDEEAPEVAVSPEQLAERDGLVAEARAAAERRQFLLAQEFLSLADASAPLDESSADLQAAVARELQPLATELEIFRQGEWGRALRSLWALREADPGNPDVERLMVDAYYNLGVRDLQRQEPAAAVENLSEALTLAGSDSEVERLLAFARTYENRPVDLLYRIFVKYVPFR